MIAGTASKLTLTVHFGNRTFSHVCSYFDPHNTENYLGNRFMVTDEKTHPDGLSDLPQVTQ